MTANHGTIKSPNYPSKYPRNADCSWTVVAPLGYKITLRFDEFLMEKNGKCNKDWLEVYDGASIAASMIGKYCGLTKPPTITSSGHKLFLQFHSNRAVQHKGFRATYNSSLGKSQKLITNM